MSIGSEPFELLADFPGWTTGFDLQARQEQSRSASGVTYVKDLGPPLWTLKAQSKVLPPNVLDHWRARLKVLEGGLYTFLGYPLSRVYPISYPKGSWPTGGSFDGVSAALLSINANRKAVRLEDLPAGFKFVIGDYLAIGVDLHQVVEATTADGGGITPEFELRPHIWPGVTAGASAVKVYRPACVMALVPGSVSTDASLSGWGSIAFQGIEIR
ncbi:hypothetical protein ABIF63_006016 [Bradyrhizobium japonicum]|uniref:Uncharacterized protein n=1 Tax=Bradyrhizobium japonicum TaxID=375 RepID=A0ABV2RY87_BRAJP